MINVDFMRCKAIWQVFVLETCHIALKHIHLLTMHLQMTTNQCKLMLPIVYTLMAKVTQIQYL